MTENTRIKFTYYTSLVFCKSDTEKKQEHDDMWKSYKGKKKKDIQNKKEWFQIMLKLRENVALTWQDIGW